MGRPRKHLPRNGLAIIRDCASRGVREIDVAKALGMSYRTWKKLRDADPEAKAAWLEAKSIEHDTLYGHAYEIATDPKHPARPTMLMFLLKARHDYRDHGPTDGAEAGVNINLTLPPALDPKQYEKLLEAGRLNTSKALENG